MIVKMKRLTLVAHKADEQAIVEALQPLEAVELIQGENTAAPKTAEQLSAAEVRVQKLADALVTLKPYGEKAGLLTAKPAAKLEEISKEIPQALQHSDELDECQRELARIRSEIEKNGAVIESLKPWLSFPADMQEFRKSKHVRYFLGMIASAEIEKLKELDNIEYQLFSEGAECAAMVAAAEEDAKSVASFLKSLEWTDFAFPRLSGTPEEASKRLEEENAALSAEQEKLTEQLVSKGEVKGAIAGAYDAAVIERDRYAAMALTRETAATFELEAWAPEDRLEDIEKTIASVTDAYCLDIRDPEEEEVPPVVVRNSKFVQPFEQVTNLYSPPDPSGMDATPHMTPFYVLLFGLMLSDTGYGVLLSIGCLFFNKIRKPKGMMGGITNVLFWGGLSTVVWGFLVGTFFGLDFDVLFGTVDLFPLLLDPMTQPIPMLILCFALGVVHILYGVILKMKLAFRDGDWQTAIFDNLSWILVVIGLIVFAGTSMVAGLPAFVGTIGLVMAALGAVMLLVFKGRSKKNILMRTASGLGELYQVTSYLSDILSYARLFALGIATGVIASVFNQLCMMLVGSDSIVLSILGFIIAVALLIALHLFNVAINTLGAFVHCARLQYVEFYGKFYEAGGKLFRPLGFNTKHVRLNEDK